MKIEVGCVRIFAVAREEIQVKVTDEAISFAFIVPNAEKLDILVPYNLFAVSGFGDSIAIGIDDFYENQAKKLFKNVKHAFDCCVQWKIFGDLLLVKLIILLAHESIVKSVIP